MPTPGTAGREGFAPGHGCSPSQWQYCRSRLRGGLQKEPSGQHRTQHRTKPLGLQMPLRTPLGLCLQKKSKMTSVAGSTAKTLETRQQGNRWNVAAWRRCVSSFLASGNSKQSVGKWVFHFLLLWLPKFTQVYRKRMAPASHP